MKTAALLVSVIWATLAVARSLPKNYDIVWKTQAPVSNGSSFSMPVGGGDMGLNVWAENNTILFYVAKDGCFDENNSMLKLGRVRLTLDPNPLTEKGPFEQRLNLEDGYVEIKGRNNFWLKLWVDVFNPVVHVEMSTSVPTHLTASYESWRFRDHTMSTAEQAQSSWSGIPHLEEVTHKDQIAFDHNAVVASHRNVNTRVFDETLKQQQLTDHKDELYNPLEDNTFGMIMFGDGLKPRGTSMGYYVNTTHKSWDLATSRRRKDFSLTIVAHTNQTASYNVWKTELMRIKKNAAQESHQKSIKWWNSFWERSHITVNVDKGEDNESFQVGRNYQLFRYMLGCNAFSKWPTRFNGALFTFDPVYVNPIFPFSADFRRWGGGTYTAQNQRLEYWPMLKTGDLDVLIPQLEFYKRIVDTGLLRGRVTRNINHTTFSEQIDQSGLPQIFNFNSNMYIFGTKRPESFNIGDEFDAWLIWLGDTVWEFAMMALDAVQYFEGFDVSPYMPFIEHSIIWYDVLYQQLQQSRDPYSLSGAKGNESLVIYPGSGCETYKGAYNPASTVSGLRALVSKILQVDPPYVQGNTTYYEGLLKRVPKTPLRIQQGHICIAPAEAYARIQNVEIPQMYPVFPWHEFGVGEPNLTYAVNTYLYDTETQEFHDHVGWKQDPIWLADMGLTDRAKEVIIKKLRDNEVNRFPTFWGPGFDWTPEMDAGGTGMIALQEMLMQTYNDKGRAIRLLPAWPSDWTADFKLHAPFNTTVTGHVENGKVSNLKVEPAERMKDVIMGNE